MANPEHLKILRRGTEAWNLWRKKNRAELPDLSHADLQGVNLRAANLNSVNLTYANLEGANLGRAYLEAADLQGATPRGAHLFEADLGHADLRQMDLRDAELWHARLHQANLRDARLIDADLRQVDLSEADLRGCDLTRTNLSGTRFFRSDLRGACLREANLESARLWESLLADTDLTAARVAHTAFDNVDLSRVEGLATVRHESASSIGSDTLDLTAAGLGRDRSRQAEVETFLRYAGVQERYIQLLRATVEEGAETGSVFIRHSLADRDFAQRLHARLQDRGIRCWLNEHPMLPGDDFEESFDLNLHPADRLLLCCSEASLTSWWLASELEHAAEKERDLEGQRGVKIQALVPINLDGYLASGRWKSRRAAEISARLSADFDGWEDDEETFERELDRAVKALQAP